MLMRRDEVGGREFGRFRSVSQEPFPSSIRASSARFARKMLSLGDDAEVGAICKGISDWYSYLMEEMKAEVPSSALDMLILLTLADQRLADQKRECAQLPAPRAERG